MNDGVGKIFNKVTTVDIHRRRGTLILGIDGRAQ